MAEQMLPKERILAAYNRQDVDRPPVCPNLIRWIRGTYGCTCEMHQWQIAEKFGFDPLIMYGMYLNAPISSDYVYRPDAGDGYRDLENVNVKVCVENQKESVVYIRRFETPDGILTDRITWARPNMGYGDGPNPHRDEPLAKSLDDIAALKHLYPKPQKGNVNDLNLLSEVVGDRGLVEYYETSNAGAWGMEVLGPEQMLMCAVENKKLLLEVLKLCQAQHLRNLKAVLESGHKNFTVSWFQCGSSVGWSPSNIEEFFLPLVRQGVELVHSYGGTYRYQDDGKMADVIPDLIEMGVDVIGGLQPPPVGDCVLGQLKEKYGNKACFFGGLDPIYTFELGSQKLIRTVVTELLEQIGDGRGVVIGLAEAFGPETPQEYLCELIKTVKDNAR